MPGIESPGVDGLTRPTEFGAVPRNEEYAETRESRVAASRKVKGCRRT
jgi:hypothetical protein